MNHELQDGINLAVGAETHWKVDQQEVATYCLLSTVITSSSHGKKGSGTKLSKVYRDQVLHVEQ